MENKRPFLYGNPIYENTHLANISLLHCSLVYQHKNHFSCDQNHVIYFKPLCGLTERASPAYIGSWLTG